MIIKGNSKKVGKKQKRFKKGKATLINLLGYKNTIKYAEKLKKNIFKKINNFGKKSGDLKRNSGFYS